MLLYKYYYVKQCCNWLIISEKHYVKSAFHCTSEGGRGQKVKAPDNFRPPVFMREARWYTDVHLVKVYHAGEKVKWMDVLIFCIGIQTIKNQLVFY